MEVGVKGDGGLDELTTAISEPRLPWPGLYPVPVPVPTLVIVIILTMTTRQEHSIIGRDGHNKMTRNGVIKGWRV